MDCVLLPYLVSSPVTWRLLFPVTIEQFRKHTLSGQYSLVVWFGLLLWLLYLVVYPIVHIRDGLPAMQQYDTGLSMPIKHNDLQMAIGRET